MTRRSTILPFTVLLCGGVGFALRRWQLSRAFDVYDLLLPGHPATLALYAWLAAMALLAVAFSRGKGEKLSLERAFPARGYMAFVAACVIAAFLFAGSTVVELLDFSALRMQLRSEEASGVLMASAFLYARLALAVAAGVAVLLLGRDIYRGQLQSKENGCTLVICGFYCLWLLSDYQNRASDPELAHYVYGMVAIIACMVAACCIMDHAFDICHPKVTDAACFLAGVLALMALANGESLADGLRFLGSAIFFTAFGAVHVQENQTGAAPAETEVKEHG